MRRRTFARYGTGSECSDGHCAQSAKENIDIRQSEAMFSCDTPISRQWQCIYCTQMRIEDQKWLKNIKCTTTISGLTRTNERTNGRSVGRYVRNVMHLRSSRKFVVHQTEGINGNKLR